jgi:hypothetical protein
MCPTTARLLLCDRGTYVIGAQQRAHGSFMRRQGGADTSMRRPRRRDARRTVERCMCSKAALLRLFRRRAPNARRRGCMTRGRMLGTASSPPGTRRCAATVLARCLASWARCSRASARSPWPRAWKKEGAGVLGELAAEFSRRGWERRLKERMGARGPREERRLGAIFFLFLCVVGVSQAGGTVGEESSKLWADRWG